MKTECRYELEEDEKNSRTSHSTKEGKPVGRVQLLSYLQLRRPSYTGPEALTPYQEALTLSRRFPYLLVPLRRPPHAITKTLKKWIEQKGKREEMCRETKDKSSRKKKKKRQTYINTMKMSKFRGEKKL